MASEWPVFAELSESCDEPYAASDLGDDWYLEHEHWECVYLHRDAARAWQALRDWCDGTYDQWMEAVDKSLDHQYEHGWDDAERHTEWKLKSWQALKDFLNGTPEQWQRRAGMAFDRGVEFSLSSYRPKRTPRYEAKPYTGDDSDD